MLTIAWVKYNDTIDILEIRNFLFKRKLVAEITIYEIWKAGELICNTSEYPEFIKSATAIIEYKIGYR